ncbi:MAG: prolipoprotein diacylglyceryl transferase [Fimbriimonas ginsengisoli]|nr:prolipoprotein diacylglyceryl transferase [Fimbriimonas ginsengisoli]
MNLGVIFTALGYVTGGIVLVLAARRKRVATDGMMWVAAWAVLSGLIGARVVEWVASGWPFHLPVASILDPAAGGRALIGGLMFGWLGAEIAKRRLGIRRSTGDLFALALPAGEAVGRIGCFYNACCYGTPYAGPMAVYQAGAWRHPAQVYSSLAALAVFALLLSLRDRMPREGDLFRLYLVLFGVTRFGLEFVRERDTRWLGLSAMQWLCLDFVIFFGWALLRSFQSRLVQAEVT